MALLGYMYFSRDTLVRYANMFIKQCSTASYPRGCYDDNVPNIMDDVSMEDAFEVIRLIRQKDPQYEYCHTGAHRIAEREVAKDSTKWADVLARCPSTEDGCAFGCLHGAFQAYYRDEHVRDTNDVASLIPALKQACSRESSYIVSTADLVTCYHGIGHVSVYITNVDIPRSLTICDEIVEAPYRHQCYEGVFMQLLNPTELEDKELVEGKAPTNIKEVASYCNRFNGEKYAVCWFSGWTMTVDSLQTGNGVVNFCDQISDEKYRQYCLRSTFRVIARHFDFDETEIKTFCDNTPREYIGQCYTMTAAHIVYVTPSLRGKAERICELPDQVHDKEECHEGIIKQLQVLETPLQLSDKK